MKRSFKLYIEKKIYHKLYCIKKKQKHEWYYQINTLASNNSAIRRCRGKIINFFFIKFQDPCGLNSRIYKGLFRFLQFQNGINCSTDLAHIAWQLLYDNRRKPIAIGQWETRVTFKHPTLLLWCYFTQKRVLKKYFKSENYLNLKHIN